MRTPVGREGAGRTSDLVGRDPGLTGPTDAGGWAAERRVGLVHGVMSNVLWGSFPLFWPLLKPAMATEILAHRITWSLVFVILLLVVKRQLAGLVAICRRPRACLALAGAAILMAVNWGTYIYGVNSGQVVQASLGYFIAPLVTVLFAVIAWREALRPAQWVSVGFGGVAVLVLTIDYGRLPWIALTLGICFGGYGVLKKASGTGSLEGFAVETLLLAVPALAWIGWLTVRGSSTMASEGGGHLALLLASGVVTTVPLLSFGAAVNRLPMATVGLLQYLAPVLQLVIGVLVLNEPMPLVRLIGFFLVWAALTVLTVDAFRAGRRNAASLIILEGEPRA